jgi:hypothetical protein
VHRRDLQGSQREREKVRRFPLRFMAKEWLSAWLAASFAALRFINNDLRVLCSAAFNIYNSRGLIYLFFHATALKSNIQLCAAPGALFIGVLGWRCYVCVVYIVHNAEVLACISGGVRWVFILFRSTILLREFICINFSFKEQIQQNFLFEISHLTCLPIPILTSIMQLFHKN